MTNPKNFLSLQSVVGLGKSLIVSCQTQLIDFIDEVQRSMNVRQQTDLLFLDFSKVFNTIPHRRLLSKLNFYGVRGQLYRWISSWLTGRHQRVIVDGISSDATPVKSGVPQGTVLGPLMFLVYINDINENITSSIRLFADNCVIYKTVTSIQEAEQLQDDLHKIYEWTNKWQMKLNVDKCTVLRCTRSETPIQYVYTLMNCNLHVKRLHTYIYLGVEIDNTMSWSPHIQTVSNRATKVFNFVKQNLGNCPASTKRIAYLTLVRPIMEYAAPVWDPFYNTDIYKLETKQRRAARWITSDYSRHTSVAALYYPLLTCIPTLQHRRNSSRLSLFYSIVNNLLPINTPPTLPKNSIPYQKLLLTFILPQATLNSFKYSFYPRTIRDWNNLPLYLIESRNLEEFTYLLNQLYLIVNN